MSERRFDIYQLITDELTENQTLDWIKDTLENDYITRKCMLMAVNTGQWFSNNKIHITRTT